MFTYEIETIDGFTTRVTTDGDPIAHPAFFGRVSKVTNLGPAGLRLMSDPTDKV